MPWELAVLVGQLIIGGSLVMLGLRVAVYAYFGKSKFFPARSGKWITIGAAAAIVGALMLATTDYTARKLDVGTTPAWER